MNIFDQRASVTFSESECKALEKAYLILHYLSRKIDPESDILLNGRAVCAACKLTDTKNLLGTLFSQDCTFDITLAR